MQVNDAHFILAGFDAQGTPNAVSENAVLEVPGNRARATKGGAESRTECNTDLLN